MNSVEALDYALALLQEIRGEGDCREHEQCRLRSEAIEALSALRETIAEPFGGLAAVRSLP